MLFFPVGITLCQQPGNSWVWGPWGLWSFPGPAGQTWLLPGASGITSALKHVCAVFPVIYQGQNTHTPLLKRFAWGGLQDSRVLDRVNSLGNTHSLLVPSRCWSPVLPCSRRLPFFLDFPSRFHSRWCCFITTGHSCCLFIRYLHGSALYGNRVSCWSAVGGSRWTGPGPGSRVHVDLVVPRGGHKNPCSFDWHW